MLYVWLINILLFGVRSSELYALYEQIGLSYAN